MIIKVAGKEKEYEEGIVLSQLIKAEEVENPEYVTVTINDEFVDKNTFHTVILQEGDEIEFLYFMGGGSDQWHLLMNN